MIGSMSSWKAVRLDDVEPIAWPYAPLTWRPVRTFVRVEPRVHRHAVAADDGTAVLALGGPPAYEPSSSEWIERARPHIRSDPGRAVAIVADPREALRADPDLGPLVR